MTTLRRRASVAVYPIRLLALALVVWSVAGDARAQSPIRVGYYDMSAGAGVAEEQEPPILAAGLTPVQLFDVTATDLAGIHILFVQNPSTAGYGSEYLAGRGAIQAAVAAGLVLVIHDRFVGPSPAMTRAILPLPPGVMPLVTRLNSNNNSVSAPDSLVANGPAGVITDENLDGGNFSNMGFVNLLTLPVPGRQGLLHTGLNPNSSVTFSYPLGLGSVIYSSIPLDFYAKGGGPAPVRDAFTGIYAPNVLSYAACGLQALPATLSVTPPAGHYGGTATLSASVRCGVLAVAGVEVEFSLNSEPVGTAVTDEFGTATLPNASLGSTPDSAIAPGTYPEGVSASFAGTSQYGASSASAALTVEKAPATITYAGGTFVYDGRPHAATGSVSGVFGESLGAPSFTYTDAVSGAVTDAAPVNAGRYVITASVDETEHYLATEIRSSATAIVINPAPLKVVADDQEKLVGAPNPVLTISYEGFVAGETAASLDSRPSATTPVVQTTPAGTYPIVVSGAADPNYVIEHVAGTFTVSPEGRIRGQGFIDGAGARHHFVFDSRETVVSGERGTLALRVDRETGNDDVFASQSVTSMTFTNTPGIVPGGGAQSDSVVFGGIGTWNGLAATFEVVAADKGEPGVGFDTVTITIRRAGLVVHRTSGILGGGNVQSNRLAGR